MRCVALARSRLPFNCRRSVLFMGVHSTFTFSGHGARWSRGPTSISSICSIAHFLPARNRNKNVLAYTFRSRKKKSPDSVSPENITEKMRLQVFPETRSERPVARRESDFGSGRKTYFQSSRIGALISARKNQRIAPSRVLSTSSLRTMGISDGV